MSEKRLDVELNTRLESDLLTVEINTMGGAIVSGRMRDGRPFLSGATENPGGRVAHGAACFPLVPLCNRVEGNEFAFGGKSYRLEPNSSGPLYLHGDGWLADWRLVRSKKHEAVLRLDKEATDGSPWAYRAEQGFEVRGPSLGLVLSVANLGREPMPFGLGFHPYFPRTPQTTLLAPARGWWTERDGGLPGELRPVAAGEGDFSMPRPLPESRLERSFEGWTGAARIVWPETRLGVEIQADKQLDRCLIFAPGPSRDFFCVEPMSHSPNALSKVDDDLQGMRVLGPGERLQVSMAITVFEAEP